MLSFGSTEKSENDGVENGFDFDFQTIWPRERKKCVRENCGRGSREQNFYITNEKLIYNELPLSCKSSSETIAFVIVKFVMEKLKAFPLTKISSVSARQSD